MYVQAVVATVKAPDNLLEHVREIRRVNQLAVPVGEHQLMHVLVVFYRSSFSCLPFLPRP